MAETSIIIRAYNEERHLPSLFRRLDEQSYRDFETVVVDSGSIDRTREIARSSATRLIRIQQHDFTFGYSLNQGVRNSEGRFIVVVSAHAIPVDSSWLGNLIEPLRDGRTAMVYGRQAGVPQSKLGEFFDLLRTFGMRRQVLTPPNFFANNANAAIRRDLWAIRAFDETLPGLEDIDWAKYWMEKGYLVVYEPTAGVHHIHEETWAQVRHRYYREGQAAKWIGISHRRQLPAEILRETAFLCDDLARAVRRREIIGKVSEIVRFRYEKTVGRSTGIWDGAHMENPRDRKQLLFDKSYRAVVIQSPRKAMIQNMEVPELKPGEVLVRVAYEGVCATDLEVLDGSLGYYKSGFAKYPIVPGHEFSGIVAARGSRVSEVEENERVVVECIQGCGQCEFCREGNTIGCRARAEVGVIGRNGGYGEYVVTPARFIHRVPGQVSLQQACLCEPLAVILKGLRRLERVWSGKPGRCAVVGAGPIGHLAALVLSHRGHDVVVFDRNAARLSSFAQKSVSTEQVLQKISSFETIIEATGDPDALDVVLSQSKAGAAILLLGLPYAKRDFSFESVVAYDKTIVGCVGSNSEDFDQALAILPAIETKPLLEHIVPLAEFSRAWDDARSGRYLKVVLEVNGVD